MNYLDDPVCGERFAALADGLRVRFCRNDDVEVFFKNTMPGTEPFTLITHNGDRPITTALAGNRPAAVKTWFAVNSEANCVRPLPIGIANSYWHHGDVGLMRSVRARELTRDKLLLIAWSDATNPARAQIRHRFEGCPWATVYKEKRPFGEYLEDLARHKIVLSPPGNGRECHRTYEARYMGAVAVTEMDPLPLEFDYWEQLWEREKAAPHPELTMAYWRQKIGVAEAPKRRLICFSLFGKDDKYVQGFLENARLAKLIYPGWEVHCWVDRQVPPAALKEAARLGARCYPADTGPLADMPHCWRFLGAAAHDMDAAIFRDCDSRLNWRERAAVDEWIQGGQRFHAMHDCAFHRVFPLFAGMWGVRGPGFPDMASILTHARVAVTGKWPPRATYDQDILRSLWAVDPAETLMHSSVGLPWPSTPFPLHRPLEPGEFVGQVHGPRGAEPCPPMHPPATGRKVVIAMHAPRWNELPQVLRDFQSKAPPEYRLQLVAEPSLLTDHYAATLLEMDCERVRVQVEIDDPLLCRLRVAWDDPSVGYVFPRSAGYLTTEQDVTRQAAFINTGLPVGVVEEKDEPPELFGARCDLLREYWATWEEMKAAWWRGGKNPSWFLREVWLPANVWALRLSGKPKGERLTLVEEPPRREVIGSPSAVVEAEAITGEGPVLSPPWRRPARRVLFSSTLDRFYSTFLPIATEAWNACGWQPTALLVGEAKEWAERPEFLLARRFGLDAIFIPRIEGFKDSTVAQVGRLFPHKLLGGRWPLHDNDYVMTGDVDMIPLSAAHWAAPAEGVTAWYGNAYPSEPPRYPLCNIGATCAVWKEMMGGAFLEGCLRSDLGPLPDEKTAWNYDELLVGCRIRAWRGFPGRLHVVRREGPAPLRDRADRVAWPSKMVPGLVDAHLPRPAKEHTGKIEDLLRVYYPEMLSWFADYMKGIS